MGRVEGFLPPMARRILLGILALLIVATSLKLHGFSFGLWHGIIDGSPASELILNDNQPIRSDDWNSHLTLALAQRNHEPPFPLVNRNIGAGQSALTHPMPAGFPLGLFRPQTWGYFLGSDLGIAWNWNFQVLALFSAVFVLLLLLTEGATIPSVLGAALVITSPFFVYWSFNSAPVATFTLLGVIAAYFVLYARSIAGCLAAGVALAWAGTSFGVCMYPPYQIPLAYLGLVLSGYLIHRNHARGIQISRPAARLAVLALSVAAIGAGGIYFMNLGSEMIQAMQGSVYPGARKIVGGGYSLSSFFSNNFVPLRAVSDWSTLGNISEASSFIFLSPWVLLAWFIIGRSGAPHAVTASTRRMLAWIGSLLTIGLIWSIAGLPRVLEHLTLLDRVPFNRAAIALGIADVALATFLTTKLASEKHKRRLPTNRSHTHFIEISIAGLLIGATLFVLLSHHQNFRWIVLRYVLILVAAQFFYLRALVRGQIWAPAWILLAQLITNATFTPLNRGGADYFEGNPLSLKIKSIQDEARAAGRSVYWAAFGDILGANLIRALGSPVLNGFYLYPQLGIWKEISLSPEQDAQIYNRLAHICLNYSPDRTHIRFELKLADYFCITLHPANTKFASRGITHLLFRNPVPVELAAPASNFTPIFTHGHYTILARKTFIASEISAPR